MVEMDYSVRGALNHSELRCQSVLRKLLCQACQGQSMERTFL